MNRPTKCNAIPRATRPAKIVASVGRLVVSTDVVVDAISSTIACTTPGIIFQFKATPKELYTFMDAKQRENKI